MSCPQGQIYSSLLKRCVKKTIVGEKGQSGIPCPTGQVWNPASTSRRCITRAVYKRLYGEPRAAAASAQQRLLRGTVKAPAKPAKIVSPPDMRQERTGAKTPSEKHDMEFEVALPRNNSTMPPGLTREKMKDWVAKQCINQDDPINLEPYGESDLKELRSLVKLGSGFCYTVDTLDKHVRSSVERGIPVKDMLNPTYRVDKRDLGALLAAGQRLRKTYKLPRMAAEIPAAHYKLFIGRLGRDNYKHVFLYDDRKVKLLASGSRDFGTAIPDGGWIGYIPAKGTEELERLIHKAYGLGRLFTQAKRPFACCRFHLKKSRAYWETDPVKKIKALINEIEELV